MGVNALEQLRVQALPATGNRLVNGEELLTRLFSPQCRPSLRWLREHTRTKRIPSVKVGNLRFYDLEAVKKQLNIT